MNTIGEAQYCKIVQTVFKRNNVRNAILRQQNKWLERIREKTWRYRQWAYVAILNKHLSMQELAINKKKKTVTPFTCYHHGWYIHREVQFQLPRRVRRATEQPQTYNISWIHSLMALAENHVDSLIKSLHFTLDSVKFWPDNTAYTHNKVPSVTGNNRNHFISPVRNRWRHFVSFVAK